MRWATDRRAVNLAGFIACVLMMAYALYAERVLGFEPCPLCMFQRAGVVGLGMIFLIAALHCPQGVRGAQRRSHPLHHRHGGRAPSLSDDCSRFSIGHWWHEHDKQ